MTDRHQFKGVPGDLCADDFGGVARCALPYDSGYHWQDNDHPYRDPGAGAADSGCVWVMRTGTKCEAPRESFVHNTFPDVEKPIVPGPVQYEIPVIPGSYIEPPDAPSRPPLPQYGGDYPEGVGVEACAMPAPEEGWERAVRWLTDHSVDLRYGPWPVRKFIMNDGAEGRGAELWQMVDALESLDTEYCVRVDRPEGAPYRVALLTWAHFLGFDIDIIVSELHAAYGRA